jgi:hypothetical protein
MVRSAGVNCTFTSFSASTKVGDETSGPTGGAVLNAGGAPAGGSSVFWALPRVATAAPKMLRVASVKNCLRDFDIRTSAADYNEQASFMGHWRHSFSTLRGNAANSSRTIYLIGILAASRMACTRNVRDDVTESGSMNVKLDSYAYHHPNLGKSL